MLLSDGRIAAVEPDIAADARVLDASATVIAPGFINAHYHSNENFNPGLYKGLPLDLWFVRFHQVTRTEPPSREAIYTRTMLGAVQLLLSGTTAVVDFVFEAPEISVETLEPIIQAYRDVGLRATVLLGVADLHYLASVDLDPADLERTSLEFSPPTVERVMAVAHDAVERWHEPGGHRRDPGAPCRTGAARCSPSAGGAHGHYPRRSGCSLRHPVAPDGGSPKRARGPGPATPAENGCGCRSLPSEGCLKVRWRPWRIESHTLGVAFRHQTGRPSPRPYGGG